MSSSQPALSNPAAERRSRSDNPPAHAGTTVLCLSLRASAEIGVLARVIQQLARRDLLPSRLHGTESGDQLLLDLQVPGVSEREGAILAESLRQVVGIEEVLTSRLLRERAA